MTKLVLLISGKRKSGKDYSAEYLLNTFGHEQAEIIRISEPIKSYWAKEKGLDLKELLSDSPYKEKIRKQMIEWSDLKRSETPEIFCRIAFEKATKPIVIVSDIRRKTDIAYFRNLIKNENIKILKLLRIHTDDKIRESRGWRFEDGVDNVQSECDLDDFSTSDSWNYEITNDNTQNTIVHLNDVYKSIIKNVI